LLFGVEGLSQDIGRYKIIIWSFGSYYSLWLWIPLTISLLQMTEICAEASSVQFDSCTLGCGKGLECFNYTCACATFMYYFNFVMRLRWLEKNSLLEEKNKDKKKFNL